jgi:hypothetical protein
MSNKRGRPSEPYQLAKKHISRQAISAAKKKDLVGLCKNDLKKSTLNVLKWMDKCRTIVIA